MQQNLSSQTAGGVASQKTLAVLHPDNAGALYFERETTQTGPGAGTAQNRHYLSAEKGSFLLITSSGNLQANPAATTLAGTEQRYWHKDHLGSIVASTNQNLTVIERLAYEPFGKRRFAQGQYDQAGSIDAQSTTRGFTGHEHLDSLDFIHMNARVYDPDIGRFLSPDPTVPGVHNPQAFNRYAYAFNSPLNLIDPDGFEPRAPDGSFADGGYRGANSGPANSGGPNAGNQGTPGAGNAVGTNIPQGRQSSGLGLKGSIADVFPDEAPIHAIGKALGTVAAHLEGLITNNKTLTEITMQGLQDDRPQNMQLAGMLMSMGRMPGRAPATSAATTNLSKAAPVEKTFETSRAARRAAMREDGIPTSQQPVSQSKNISGREYTYSTPKPGGGLQEKSVQQQTMDRSHKDQLHWEAGPVKTDPLTGATREGNYGRPALTNDKSKAYYQ